MKKFNELKTGTKLSIVTSIATGIILYCLVGIPLIRKAIIFIQILIQDYLNR